MAGIYIDTNDGVNGLAPGNVDVNTQGGEPMATTPVPTPPKGWNSWDCYGTTVTEAEVLAHCRAKIAAFKVPQAVVVIDAIPKNANGKIDRQALAALWDRQTGRLA